MVGIAIGAAATTGDVDVAELDRSRRRRRRPALRALSVLGGAAAVPDALPRALGVEDACAQLAQFLSN